MYCPATPEAKSHATIGKVYVGALYGVDAASVGTATLNKLAAAVIDVFRSRNNYHNVDWFFATFLKDQKDLDPYGQVFTRRALQIRRTICKTLGSLQRFQKIFKEYVERQSSNIDGGHLVGNGSDHARTPSWYRDAKAENDQQPEHFPLPMDRKR